MMKFTSPKALVFVGPVAAAIVGTAMPTMGFVLSHMLGYLVTPLEFL